MKNFKKYFAECTDHSEASKARYLVPESKAEDIETISEEIWKLIPLEGNTMNYCSNLGRFKVMDKNGKERLLTVYRSKNKTGKTYYDVSLYNPEGHNIKCRSHRVIAKTFIDSKFDIFYEKGSCIVCNHIDGNSENNKLNNIEICTQSENIKKAIYDEGKEVGKKIKKCYAFNVKTKEYREYISTKELVRDIWHKENAGYFNSAYNHKSISEDGWTVGYVKEDK